MHMPKNATVPQLKKNVPSPLLSNMIASLNEILPVSNYEIKTNGIVSTNL